MKTIEHSLEKRIIEGVGISFQSPVNLLVMPTVKRPVPIVVINHTDRQIISDFGASSRGSQDAVLILLQQYDAHIVLKIDVLLL